MLNYFPFFSRFGDADDDDGAASVAASKSSKLPVLDKLGDEDGNISVGSVTNVVKDRVGNLLGKGIGGLSTKFGSGSWF
jgi:calcium-dependent secretion activator